MRARAARTALAGSFALVALASARDASALGGTAFGEASRVSALADSATAREGDVGSLVLNPASLADQTEPVVAVGGQVGQLRAWFARDGEPRASRDRWIGGYGFAVGTPLPGAWLRHVRVGLSMHLPAAHVLQVTVPERVDAPMSPVYDARPERPSMAFGVAGDPWPWLHVGAALVVVPTLTLPTAVTYQAGRSGNPETDLTVRLDRDLQMVVAPIVGLRVDPWRKLGLALVWRSRAQSIATGDNRTVAGGVLADDPLRYASFWDPTELVAGVVGRPTERLSLSLDVARASWSAFHNGYDESVAPTFRDVWSTRVGVEGRVARGLVARGGWAYEPSPVTPQVALTNYLDADTQVLALGAGVDLRELAGLPVTIDAHARARLGATQSVTKETAHMADADPTLPGRQIDSLGYPGYASQSRFFQAGVTVTFFVGKKGAK